ncbi:phosphate signaling complex PhoU family protein [Rhodococcus coprophilus]|uniref:Phosphate transport system protein PhoU n=1 Tax=Rhodococcus coprophilus TaxID=38310 RepID=A0A2X4UBH0_9NOCA|nr:PhoU domain-containing protein [Rhodococcus coprophilus]MBM7459409.1 phosphate transport system protein [Rhodococcus coprophilus]SQI35969.1 phosphate transport system protein PhoU [Rhodococcus coprophilus]
MREVFTGELNELLERLGELGALAAEGLESATEALFGGDLLAAQNALDLDVRLDELTVDSAHRAMKILALQAPVATDLRLVFSAVRISGDLSRMVQLTLHIARVARRRFPDMLARGALHDDLVVMAELASRIAAVLRDVFTHLDLDTIRGVRTLQRELDVVHSRVLATVEGKGWDGDVPTAVNTVLVARFYGRFGDQAADVADRLIFFVTGERPAEVA